MRTSLDGIYRFGPFQVNAIAGELLKDGNRIKLQEQPFRLLVVLLENAGEMVTRAELRNRIWPQDTFVDFDSSLRVAVRKLREALGDDAENPQYVETIPKRGYRFLLVDVFPEDAVQPAPNATIENLEPVEPAPSLPRSRKWIALAVLLLVVVVAATVVLSRRRQRVLTAQDTIVLADFVNNTGDPVFDGTLRQGLAVQLEQSPFLSLISEERLQQTLGLMGQPADVGLTPAVAREICERTASAAVLDGSITSLGSRYVLGLRAKECRSGKVLAEEQVQAGRKEEVLSALGQVASRFRARLGESLTTVEKHNSPLAEATTPSLEALKAYSIGWKVAYSEGDAAALPFFKRAVSIDPQFAAAYAALGLMYGTTGESDLAAGNASKAYALLNRVSDKEKFFIAAYYDGRVTGNQEKAQQTCETWMRIYDRDVAPHSFLAGFIYPASGKYMRSVEEDRKGLQLDPYEAILYLELGSNLAALDRLEDAKSALRIASDRNLNHPLLLVEGYDIAFLQADKAGMDRAVTLARGKIRGRRLDRRPPGLHLSVFRSLACGEEHGSACHEFGQAGSSSGKGRPVRNRTRTLGSDVREWY